MYLFGLISNPNTPRFERVSFKSEEEKMQLVESLAERITTIYAAFLTADWHANRDQSLPFFDFPKAFPPAEKVENFKTHLKREFIDRLSKGDECYDSIRLRTDNGPEETLASVLEKSDIDWSGYEVYKLFPEKTTTSVSISKERKLIEIRINPKLGSFKQVSKF